MKKLFTITAAVCVAVYLGTAAFAAVSYTAIYDNGGYFSDSEYSRLLDKAEEISEETGLCIMIITEEGKYTESEARSKLKTWYKDDFGSSQKGAGLIMTSETRGGTGNNYYSIVMETFGGASINKTQTYRRVEDFFLDYDEYGGADAFLSACGKTENSSSEGGVSTKVAVIITIVLIIVAFVISAIKKKILRKFGIYDSGGTGYGNRRNRSRNRNSISRGGGSGGSRGGGRRGKR
jgi:uncharacterized membrane protein YgcG